MGYDFRIAEFENISVFIPIIYLEYLELEPELKLELVLF